VGGAVQSASGASSTVNGATGAASSAVNAAKASANQASTNTFGTTAGSALGGNSLPVQSDLAAAAAAGKSFSEIGVKGADDGVFSAEDYFNAKVGLGNLSGTGLSETLSGISGFTDCNGDKNIDVRFDGMYIPPSDRQTPDIDADYLYFYQGYNWDGSASIPGSPPRFPTADQGFATYLAYYNSDEVQAITGQRVEFSGTDTVGSGTPPVFVTRNVDIYNIATGNFVGSTTASMSSGSCSLGDPTCPTEPPVSYLWPISDTFQMVNQKYDSATGAVLRSATFAANRRDPNVSAGFAGETSNMTLCFGSGRMANIQANNLGGNIVREVSAVDGTQVGYARIYDSQNVLVGYSDSAGLANYLP